MEHNKPAAAKWRAFDIQAAIDAASPGDTVNVPPGTYNEQLVIDKPLTLTGPEPGAGTAIIDATGLAAVSTIRITADDVTVHRLTIQNGQTSAVLVGAAGFENLTGIVIRQNVIQNNNLAGVITGTGAAMLIRDNVIENNGLGTGFLRVGIYLSPHGVCRVCGNTIHNNGTDGLYAEGSSTGLLIEDNNIDGHSNSGITLAWDETNVTIRHNEITNNGSGAGEESGGIAIIQSMAEEISGNTITNGNFSGIHWGWTPSLGPPPPQILIQNNVIADCTRDAVYLFSMGPGGFIPPDPFPLTPLISGNRLKNNGRAGVYVSNFYYYSPGNADPAIHANNITGNEWGVFNATAGTVDATGNWWGADSGPFQETENPGGQGDPVSDRVLFDPWLRQAALECIDETGNCADCCAVFTDTELRNKFGYQEESATCQCHDITVREVRAVCVKEIRHTLKPPGVGSLPGCRGIRPVGRTPVLDDCRVLYAAEHLRNNSPDRCLAVHNTIGLEFRLQFDAEPEPIYLAIRDTITADCTFDEFTAFPSGAAFTAEEFTDLIKFIDGSAKTIIIASCAITGTTDPRIEITLKLVDKLWKYENLLVSALRPYPENITVTQEFNGAHKIGPC